MKRDKKLAKVRRLARNKRDNFLNMREYYKKTKDEATLSTCWLTCEGLVEETRKPRSFKAFRNLKS